MTNSERPDAKGTPNGPTGSFRRICQRRNQRPEATVARGEEDPKRLAERTSKATHANGRRLLKVRRPGQRGERAADQPAQHQHTPQNKEIGKIDSASRKRRDLTAHGSGQGTSCGRRATAEQRVQSSRETLNVAGPAMSARMNRAQMKSAKSAIWRSLGVKAKRAASAKALLTVCLLSNKEPRRLLEK